MIQAKGMEMSTKRVCVRFFIVVLVELWFCEGCWKQERDALLHLKAQFYDPTSPANWVDGSDCCLWEDVECNNTTRRVAKLALSGRWNDNMEENLYLNMSDFYVFGALESLQLGSNGFVASVQNNGNETRSWLSGLEFLDLSFNTFSNDIISSINDLKQLKQLDLSGNQLEGSVNISELYALTKLEILRLSNNNIRSFAVDPGTKLSLSNVKELYLDGCNIDGSMLKMSLTLFPSIKKLYLNHNQFDGTILAGDFGELDNLEHLELNFSSNIQNEFFKSIGSLTSLKVLSMESCGISGTLPNGGWSKLKKLEQLCLHDNKFEGSLPLSFANMTSLKTLDISSNSFTKNPAINFATLVSLESLDFSDNQFDILASFEFLANYSNIKFIYGSGNKVIPDPYPTILTWVPKFQLQEFHFPSTTQASSLRPPNFLVHQYNLTVVDFSDTKFGGHFPNWLMENNTKMETLSLRNCSFTGHFQLPSRPIPNMHLIDVSSNSIAGQIPANNFSSIFPNLKDLYMSKNEFDGSLPHDFGQMMGSLGTLDLSSNNLSGEIPRTVSVVESSLTVLILSKNKIEGSIPTELLEQPLLEFLDLSENSLSGLIPSFASSLSYVYLSSNRLSGLTTMLFNESSSLVLLDLTDNEITGHLEDIMGNTSKLIVLLLKRNQFVGKIPIGLCKLGALTILDLSFNKLSGPIPKCVSELPLGSTDIWLKSGGYLRKVNFTTKKRSETYQWENEFYMSGMDLSHNKLNGNIPLELGNLKYIRGLNLSHNHLSGPIPTTLSNLKCIESLDLSFNNLTGEIPSQLIELTSLEVFSLAYNNLSGRMPERKNQFITFDESCYEGNPFLCGAPSNKSCSNFEGQPNGSLASASDYDEVEEYGFMDMESFFINFAVSYASVLSLLIIVLYLNPYWRQAWFDFIEFVITKCYYFSCGQFS